jgi:serine protease Do
MRVSILLIGLLAAGAVPPPNSYAQDTEPMSQLAQEFQQLTPAVRPAGGSYLGVSLGEIDADRASALKLSEERGVEVKEVQQGSPAEAAGIKAGDVILTYNGENVLGAQQFMRLVQETPQGRKVRIQLWRDGRTQNVTATIGGRPARVLEPSTPFVGIDMPRVRVFSPLDVPSPLLLWKNMGMGIEYEPVDSQLAQYFGVTNGVLVRSVEKGSPADRAGLKAGDVIFAVGHRNLTTARDFTASLRQPGASVSISLMRDRRKLDVTVALPAEQH